MPDFAYYEPINKQQREFHQSKAKHKLLIGGYGSGKTYPAMHESLFICYDNPGHEFMILRNTWDSLRENVEREFIDIAAKAKCIKNWDKTVHDLTLTCDTTIRFRPLSMSRAQFKGLNVCGFFIDDPAISRHKETISFLFTRLRNSPKATAKYFATVITANYEGHDWLWQTYMRGKEEGGDDRFAYWICPTGDNPTLEEHFIDDLKAVHSESWMQRFVYCNINQSYTGLIYDEYNHKFHNKDLSWCFKDDKLTKIVAIDVGVTDPTVVLKIATDGENVYVYDEFYMPDCRTNILGEYLEREIQKDTFKVPVIDPASAKRDPKTHKSLRDDIRKDFGINTVPANNALLYGIETVKTVMTIRDDIPHFFVDADRCPNTIRELEVYRWKEPEMSEFDELAYKEEPVDKDNHCMDAMRYGIVYLRRYISKIFNKERDIEERRRKLWEERYDKLKFYKRKNNVSYEAKRLREIHYGTRKKLKLQRKNLVNFFG